MHDFTAPISPRLAAALHRVWPGATIANCPEVSRGAETRAQAAQLNDWENDGGTPAPRVSQSTANGAGVFRRFRTPHSDFK
jgi:hypothetical protein